MPHDLQLRRRVLAVSHRVRPFVPSVLILRAVRTSAKRVALNMTVPSLFRGMFMATSLCRKKQPSWRLNVRGQGAACRVGADLVEVKTLQATL